MAIDYLTIHQCEPTEREEVTRILTDVSENGVIRGRVMHKEPTYRLSLSHTALTLTEFQTWETWWKTAFNREVKVTWAVDKKVYQGIFETPPRVEHESWQRVSVFVTLLVKHA